MDLIERHSDVITGSDDMETLNKIENFPVFMGCVNHSQDHDILADQIWEISRKTGVLQLKKLIPLKILYQSQHDPGTVGQIWLNHHKEFAKFINDYHPTSVLEIGGAHGILAKNYQKNENIPWVIIEPNPIPVENCRARFIEAFFDDNFHYNNKFDSLVHSHVFEHIYNPDKFVNNINKIMEEGGKLLFSIPNLKEMISRNYTNALNFEHTVFLTEPYVDFLLAKYGFKILKKSYFMDDHSIFYAAVKDTSTNPIELPPFLYKQNKELFMNYINYHRNLIRKLNEKISDAVEPVYLFGAHVFSQFLLEMGLNEKKIICLLDNDPKKIGSRLYGSRFKVEAPDILKNVNCPIVILKAGIYNEEIKAQILGTINNNVIFLE